MGRARVIQRTYDYEPNDKSILKWEEAPDAPEDFENVLPWNDEFWDKSYGGHVLAPAVRDALFEHCGGFATFWTPLFLDEQGFRKFCYLVAGGDDNEESWQDYADGRYTDRSAFCTLKLPSNYLPFDYQGEPLEWAWQQYQQRENKKRMSFLQEAREEFLCVIEGDLDVDQEFREEQEMVRKELEEEDALFVDADGWVVKSNDQVRLVNYTETELNGTIGTVYFHDPQGHRRDHVNVFMPSICEDTALSISIHNLRKFILSGSDYPNGLDSSFESLVDWDEMPPERDDPEGEKTTTRLADLGIDVKQHISSFLTLWDVERNLRRACRDTFWNFQKPPPDVLEYDFIYFYATNDETEEWHGVAHTTRDVYRALKHHDWQSEERLLSVGLTFIKFDRDQPMVPFFKYENSRDPDKQGSTEWDPIGVHYCGVQQASHIDLEYCSVLIDELNDPTKADNEDFVAVLRHCDDWTPRAPRIPLHHFGTRKADCEQCGKGDAFCRCEGNRPGGDEGKDIRVYYCPQWFEKERHAYTFSWPQGSSEKTVVLFEHKVTLRRFL